MTLVLALLLVAVFFWLCLEISHRDDPRYWTDCYEDDPESHWKRWRDHR